MSRPAKRPGLRRNHPILAAALGAFAVACAATPDEFTLTTIVLEEPLGEPAELDWRAYFEDVSEGAILVRLDARRLSYWSPDGQSYREFPIAIAETPDFERVGETSIVRRAAEPGWTPTPAMRLRNPELPGHVPPGPDNPMGKYALYLGWTYYAIHGTNDPASIGRATTSGCIRMFAEHIEWLYRNAEIGTPVMVMRGDDVQLASRASQD